MSIEPFELRPPPERVLARTYQLNRSLVKRVNDVARELQVWPSDLVRFLLERGIDQIEAGELTVPTAPAYRQIIQPR